MVSFKGAQYPKDVILFAVFFYVRYGVSYRDLEEIMGERGVQVDHTTLNRWVIYGIQVQQPISASQLIPNSEAALLRAAHYRKTLEKLDVYLELKTSLTTSPLG